MAPTRKISPEDLKVCRAVHADLVSKERSKINYLFLEPVDVSFFPDYLKLIQRPMDLKTLGENLENGVYMSRNEFYADTQMIFENAILFNKDRADSNFVVGLAKRMSKAYKRARETAETREIAAVIKDDVSPASTKHKSDRATSDAAKPEKKKKIKLKLKRNSSVGELSSTEKASSLNDAPVADTAIPKSDESDGNTKPSQLKFKLKLSKKLKENEKSIETEAASKDNSPETKNEAAPKKKIKLKISRGKELPKGVSADGHTAQTTSSSSAKSSKQSQSSEKSLKSTSEKIENSSGGTSENPDPPPPTNSNATTDIASIATADYGGALMNSARRAECYKIISSLKRREHANCKWFMKPVSDKGLVKDYKEKILNPMDLGTLSSKLDKNLYPTIAHFVLDLRRVFANCLQYNTTINDSFREAAVECLATAEDLLSFFIAKKEAPDVAYPSLLYCWEDCVKAIDSLLTITNPEDGHQTAWFFLQPVSFFCQGSFPEGYLDKVKRPIDLGTIQQKLITGCYSSVGAFVTDCRTVTENCKTFYAGTDDGKQYVEKADRLHESMEIHLGKLVLFDRSDEGIKGREKAKSKSMVIKKPEAEFLKGIMKELRATQYTDRSTKLTESATMHFEKPVDTKFFADYLTFVENPMSLEEVDRKIESGSYQTPEDFEYDIALIFKNCERYNQPKNNVHMLALGKHTAKTFRKLFAGKMRSLERGGSFVKAPLLPTASNRDVSGVYQGGKKRPLSPGPEDRKVKRSSTTDSSKTSTKAPSRTAPKPVSISTGGKSAGKSVGKSVGKSGPKKPPKAASGKKTSSIPKPVPLDLDVPVPMHVAIASIKESYPGRRGNKDLEGWEEECLRFLRQLMKHPWISAEQPKYIFHVPVHIIFPEIRESYAKKIENPMDLTTAEAKLLQGAYANGDEFISDISLIFSNAITFNQDGHDIGEPMSCAYYEASTHLLKYSRWLSLEFLKSCLSDSPDSPIVEKGSASNWKLTVRNREMARKEMEDIVFNELLEKTEKGDKLSWSELECEKLLKSLRHMSDVKHMMYFVQMTSFPPDYTAYISKPIAWEKCQEKLRDWKYDTIGDIVADLRLIFSNALKYNGRLRLTSEVSEKAYDSANHMSRKLEAAIDRMLLSIGDKIGREKIDMITSHREMEALERADEEHMKLQWEKEHTSSKVEVKTKLRVIHQRSSHRKHVTDFEFPFYDEENDHEESHVDSVRHAKSLFEKQQKARAAMKDISLAVGLHVYERLEQRAAARAWAYRMSYKAHMERKRKEEKLNAFKQISREETVAKPDNMFVSSILNGSERKQIKIALQKPRKPKRKLLTSL